MLQELVGSAIRLVACVSANNPRLKFAWLNMRLGSSWGGSQRPPSHTAIILVSLLAEIPGQRVLGICDQNTMAWPGVLKSTFQN